MKSFGAWRRRAATAAMALALGAFAGGPAFAEVHALVMGFDNYVSKVSLEGSRNDAADIASVLRKRGVSDITVLNEQKGTRADVEAAWAAMTERAQPGDLLFVSFSGHGNRSPEVGEPKHHPDGFDKGFLLPLYDEISHPEEQLRDEHLYDLFKAASDRGLKVIFVADACHSGATVRAVSTKTVIPKFQRFETHGKPLPPPPAPDKVVRRPPIANLTIYSAADESQSIQEFLLDDQKRGALSYAVARGLAGAAADQEGNLSEGDLGRYVVTNVRVLSNNTQIPSAVTPDPEAPIFAPAPATPKRKPAVAQIDPAPAKPVAPQRNPSATAAPVLPALGDLALFSASEAQVSLSGVKLVAREGDASLSFHADGQVINAHGDVVASGITPNKLQQAVDAARVLTALAKTMGERGGALSTNVAAIGKPASDRYYLTDEKVRIAAEASPLRFLTVVDLTADGTVQFLWPHKGDPVQWPGADAPHFDVAVTAPYGQDTLVFIESDKPLPELDAALTELDQKVEPQGFYEQLKLWLPQVKFKLGLQALFTCPKLKEEDGTCVMP